MESVTARRQNQFRQFRFGCAFADLVRRALQNLIEAEHDAFVGVRIKIVKFREGVAGTIHYVRSCPIDGLAFLPAARLQKIIVLPIQAATVTPRRNPAADALHPFAAERVVEHRATVVHIASLNRLAPMDAVRTGKHQCGKMAIFRPVRFADEHLETLRFIRRLLVQPNRARIQMDIQRQHKIASCNDIQLRPLPMDAITACRVCHVAEIACHIPHLEQTIRRIMPDTAAFRHRRRRKFFIPFIFCRRNKQWVTVVFHGTMEHRRHAAFIIKKIIAEKLPSNRDIDNIRRIGKIRHTHGLEIIRIDVLRRPFFRQFDSIVQCFRHAVFLSRRQTSVNHFDDCIRENIVSVAAEMATVLLVFTQWLRD